MTKLSVVLVLLAILNLAGFTAMGLDKHFAKTGQRRIPEKTLFGFALLFGAVGAAAGMFAFRHKTRHWYFRLFFPLLGVLQAAVLAFAVYQGWL